MNGYESRTDVISSVVVFLSILIMQLFNHLSIFKYVDKMATILVVFLIMKIGFELLRENISIVVEEQETDTDI